MWLENPGSGSERYALEMHDSLWFQTFDVLSGTLGAPLFKPQHTQQIGLHNLHCCAVSADPAPVTSPSENPAPTGWSISGEDCLF